MPVDIEKASVDGRFAILENIQPPGIVTAHHSHVVGHDVEYQSHAVFAESSHQAVEVFGAADFGVQRVVVHDVVPVHAAGAGLQAWRNIAMTYAECGKVGNDRRSLSKS